MSRYTYSPPGWPPQCKLLVGWDDPLGTYFGLVLDPSLGQGDAGIVAAFGGEPPRFDDLDKLMRVVNGRLRDRLPPVQLPGELRQALRKDARAKHPVINDITVTSPGGRKPNRPPLARPIQELGTATGYRNAGELRGELDGLAATLVRLDRLYWEKKAIGLSEENDEETKRIRLSLEGMSMVCHILSSLVHVPETLVADEALRPFREIAAEAARVLSGEAAPAAETVH